MYLSIIDVPDTVSVFTVTEVPQYEAWLIMYPLDRLWYEEVPKNRNQEIPQLFLTAFKSMNCV